MHLNFFLHVEGPWPWGPQDSSSSFLLFLMSCSRATSSMSTLNLFLVFCCYQKSLKKFFVLRVCFPFLTVTFRLILPQAAALCLLSIGWSQFSELAAGWLCSVIWCGVQSCVSWENQLACLCLSWNQDHEPCHVITGGHGLVTCMFPVLSASGPQ